MRAFLMTTGVVVCLGAVWACAQQSKAPEESAEASIKKAAEGYGAALKSGDIKQAATFWAADAEFTDSEGNVLRGRDEIAKRLTESLDDLKTGKSVIHIQTFRVLTPDVVTTDGAIEFTPAEGAMESDKFSAVWMRKDGRWVIASARDLPESDDDIGARSVNTLKWLQGNWSAEQGESKITLSVKPELDGKFHLMRYEIKSAKDAMTIVQLVGWDPIDAAVRSWTFDSKGGYGEGVWNRQDSSWINETLGVLPTGQITSALNHVEVQDPDTFLWHATNREVEGQPIPDNQIKFSRVVAKN